LARLDARAGRRATTLAEFSELGFRVAYPKRVRCATIPRNEFPDQVSATSHSHGEFEPIRLTKAAIATAPEEFSMTAIFRTFAFSAALLLGTISATWAEEQTIDLRVGFKSSFVLDKSFETVLIGDSDVVDVHTPDNRLVILEPLAPGATNLVFLDDKNIVVANIAVLVRQSAVNLVGKIP
jgi:Flp pilus assembly secretin CpaC